MFRIPPPHARRRPSADSHDLPTVEQESIEFVRYSLAPWLRRIELAISNDRDLAFQRQYVKFEIDGMLRADATTRGRSTDGAGSDHRLDDPRRGPQARGPATRTAGAPPQAAQSERRCQ